MPFTPFHAGPAFFVKAVKPEALSLPVFGFANTLVDVEVLALSALGSFPTHVYTHSFVGAQAAALVAILMGAFLLPWLARIWNAFAGASGFEEGHWLHMGARPTRMALVLSAFSGAWSHVLLDALHHRHAYPLWPFTEANPLLVDGLRGTQVYALALCVIGFAAILLTGYLRKRKQAQAT